jgi:hypothetical protein
MRRIAAVTVNHNTSLYTELLLRSLFATHPPVEELGLSVTVLDNDSEDDASALRAYAAAVGVPVLPSGFNTHTAHNSHGENLRNFVLGHPEATHYLFLDTDAVFSQPNAIGTMADELDAAPEDVFAIGARMAYPWTPTEEVKPEHFANLYERRLHPFCALFRNTGVFRLVAKHIGFSCAKYLWADREQYLDTDELMTIVMRTHGLRYARSSVLVGHFFAVSYSMYGEDYARHHARERDVLLEALRGQRQGIADSAEGESRP